MIESPNWTNKVSLSTKFTLKEFELRAELSVRFHLGRFCSSPKLKLLAKPDMASSKSNLKLKRSIKFSLESLCSSAELELFLKRWLGSVWLSSELELSPTSHLGSLCLSPELELLLTPNLGESSIESWAGAFNNDVPSRPDSTWPKFKLWEEQLHFVLLILCYSGE